MSTLEPDVDLDALEDPICELCGCPITELGQACMALDDGECGP